MPDPLISIIVPVYNEANTVGDVIARLLAVPLPAPREILVVDDGSTDGTAQVLRGLRPSSDLRIIHAPRNAGKGSAIRLGLAESRGSVIAIQDADLELDPSQIADLVAPILDGRARVVYGSRFLQPTGRAPWVTLAANRFLTATTNLLYGAALTDMETCYKVMRADVARTLDLESDRFEIEPEITAKLLLSGERIHEVPVRFDPRPRHAGKKIGWRDGVRALQTLLHYRFRRAPRS
jgi:glycosyltransferase involved in cell wall biosynthesis